MFNKTVSTHSNKVFDKLEDGYDGASETGKCEDADGELLFMYILCIYISILFKWYHVNIFKLIPV